MCFHPCVPFASCSWQWFILDFHTKYAHTPQGSSRPSHQRKLVHHINHIVDPKIIVPLPIHLKNFPTSSTLNLTLKVFNISWPSLIKVQFKTKVWPFEYDQIVEFFNKVSPFLPFHYFHHPVKVYINHWILSSYVGVSSANYSSIHWRNSIQFASPICFPSSIRCPSLESPFGELCLFGYWVCQQVFRFQRWDIVVPWRWQKNPKGEEVLFGEQMP